MRKEKGSALIVALIIVLIVVGISGAFLVDTTYKSKHAFAARESDEAQMICEAALEKTRRALYVYKTESTYEWDQILWDHAELSIDPADHWQDYLANREDEYFRSYAARYDEAGVDTQADAPLPEDQEHFLGVSRPFGLGAFYVVIRDNDDGDDDEYADSDSQLLVYVTASLPDGTQRQIEALVYWRNPRFTPRYGILIDGNGRFNGTPNVTGEMGTVHANGDIVLEGDPTFVSVDATGEIVGSSDSALNEHVLPVDVPNIRPADFLSDATYIFRANGEVVDGLTGLVIARNEFGGWRKSGSVWSFSTNGLAPPGAYFIEGDAKLTGGPLEQTMSIIATGNIEISGSIKFRPFLENTLFLAGGDIDLNGTAGSTLEGLVAANEQIRTSGTFYLRGSVVSKNAGNSFQKLSRNEFGGTMTIHYDGGMATIIRDDLNTVPIRAMRRLK